MQIYIIDSNAQTRDILEGRIDSALQQTGIKRISINSGDPSLLNNLNPTEDSQALTFIGPGSFDQAQEIIAKNKLCFPNSPIVLILDNDRYVTTAVELRRELQVRIIPIADIAQMAQMILDWQSQLGIEPGVRNLGLVSLVQLCGGVGGTSMALALASCWATHNLNVAVIDLDDLNPCITTWGRIQNSRRSMINEFLSIGRVPKQRLNEILEYPEQYASHLAIVGQPENYRDSFHFKADIIDNAPSAADFIESLITGLKEEFDVIVVDTGRSWGVSTFSILKQSQHVLLTINANHASLHQSLENLKRLARESEDKQEFNFSQWRIILNQLTKSKIQLDKLEQELKNYDLFSTNVHTNFVPFSESAQQWAITQSSFYDLAEQSTKNAIEKLALSIISFSQDQRKKSIGIFRKFLSPC